MRRVMCTALVLLALTAVACDDEKAASAPSDRVELAGGGRIRLGETVSQRVATLTAYESVWRTNARRSLFVAAADHRVVAIVVSQGGGTIPIPGFRFGASFEALARQLPAFRPVSVADRPGLVLEASTWSLYALSVPEYTTCEHRPTASQVALVLPGYQALLERLLAAQPCEPAPAPDLP